MINFEAENHLMLLISGVSLVSFFSSLILIPWLIIRLPRDYFTDAYRHKSKLKTIHPLVYFLIRAGKNALGLALIVAGLAMLILPGQGVLTILIGIGLVDFPGKYGFERRLVSRPRVWRSLNWIRSKAAKEPLIFPETR